MARKQLIAVLTLAALVLTTATAEAQLFRRNRTTRGGGGYQSFPANTPPAPANCVGDQCRQQLVLQSVAPQVPTLAPPEVSIVVATKTSTSLQIAEARLAEVEAMVVEARAAVAKAKLAAKREAALLAIEEKREADQKAVGLRAQIESVRLSQANQLEDLSLQLESLAPQTGGDPAAPEE